MATKLMQKSNNRQELFDNTIKHFNSINRATNDNGGCKYRLDGKGCAIGREISDKLAKKLDIAEVNVVSSTNIFDKLPQRLQRMGRQFLFSIQELHDVHDNWNENGLSEDGIKEAKLIAEKYKLNTSVLETKSK